MKWWIDFFETILVFPLNFLDFRLDTIEKYGFINLCSCSSKGYASVVLSDSEDVFFKEEEDATFCSFLFCCAYRPHRTIKEVCYQIFLSSILQEVYHRGLQLSYFYLFIFFSNA